jgi:hypothetical protein
MANTRNLKKNMNQDKSTNKRNSKANEKIHIQKNKMRGDSKQAILIMLLQRSGGASIDEMVETSGWQQHSIRGMMSGVLKKRLGLSITSEKEELGRVYRIAA